MGLDSSGDNFLTNAVLDLSAWMRLENIHGISRATLEEASELYAIALRRADESASLNVYISLQHRADLQLELLIATDILSNMSESDFEKKSRAVLNDARKAGIRGIELRLGIGYRHWLRGYSGEELGSGNRSRWC